MIKSLEEKSIKAGGAISMIAMGMVTGSQATLQSIVEIIFGSIPSEIGVSVSHIGSGSLPACQCGVRYAVYR